MCPQQIETKGFSSPWNTPMQPNAFSALEMFSVMDFKSEVHQVPSHLEAVVGFKVTEPTSSWTSFGTPPWECTLLCIHLQEVLCQKIIDDSCLDWGSHVRLRMSSAWPMEPKNTPSTATPVFAPFSFCNRLLMSTRNRVGERTNPTLLHAQLENQVIGSRLRSRDPLVNNKNYELFSSTCRVFRLNRGALIECSTQRCQKFSPNRTKSGRQCSRSVQDG